MYDHMKFKIILPLACCVLAASCASLKPTSFKYGKAKLDPVAFFGGNTSSYGVMESRTGKPSMGISTHTKGAVKDGIVYIEQDLLPENGKPNHRSWQLKQIDANHVEATASDISGKATGELYGNYFTWTFRLKLQNRGLIKHVRMSQYMYLMPDGETLMIRSVIRKFGLIVTEISEVFEKEGKGV